MNQLFLFCLSVMITVGTVVGQTVPAKEQDVAYTRTLTQRADKIVKTLAIADSLRAIRVRDMIVHQYRSLNEIHGARDEKIKIVKNRKDADKAVLDTEIKTLEGEANSQLDKLHAQYLSKLSTELTSEQVDKVKDGMTYGVLPITYKGYLEMLPTLTEEQKKQIMTYLTEAREHAMDAGSSEEKHHWFGKYKGKINNYLSSAGYDMKKAGEDWDKRRKAGKS